jgi:hypothetical protein
MADENDDVFDGDEEAADDFDHLTELLLQHVSDFAEEEDVPDEILSMLLLRLSLTIRMMTYALSVAKPSAGGLKLDLDRFRRDADELIRDMKKNADQLITQARETLATAGLEDESEA